VSEPGRLSAPEAARALRTPGTLWPAVPEGFASSVLRVDPAEGARGVFRDAPVVACFSRPADRRTVSTDTFLVVDEEGVVPGEVWTSLDGRVAVWTPSGLLAPGRVHCVRLAGIRDYRGRDVRVHESAFVPGLLARSDLGP
jgi:Big-like domain-containing protein